MRPFLATVVLTLIAGCVSPATQARITEVLSLEGEVAAGEELWSIHCSSCHGVDGSGGTEIGLLEITRTEERLVEIVVDGLHDMPSFGDRLSDHEIAHLLSFLDVTLGVVGDENEGGHEH